MIAPSRLKKLAKEHGTPLFIIDHDALRANYRQFRKYLPRIQIYYAVKANSDPAIVRTLFKEGSSFDVASMPEFMIVYENIKGMPAKQRQDWIWDKIIYANPTKPVETLEELNQYKPLVTFDNLEEIHKIKKHAPNAGLCLRLKVPNTGAMVELSSKFGALPGEAVDLILAADVMAHRNQVDRLRNPGPVTQPLEDGERFLVVRQAGLRLVEVGVPVPHAIQAAGHEQLVAERARDVEGLATKLPRTGVVARRPQLA